MTLDWIKANRGAVLLHLLLVSVVPLMESIILPLFYGRIVGSFFDNRRLTTTVLLRPGGGPPLEV